MPGLLDEAPCFRPSLASSVLGASWTGCIGRRIPCSRRIGTSRSLRIAAAAEEKLDGLDAGAVIARGSVEGALAATRALAAAGRHIAWLTTSTCGIFMSRRGTWFCCRGDVGPVADFPAVADGAEGADDAEGADGVEGADGALSSDVAGVAAAAEAR